MGCALLFFGLISGKVETLVAGVGLQQKSLN
jgi:hypothetical protein